MDYHRMPTAALVDALHEIQAALVERPEIEYLTVTPEAAADALTKAMRSVEREGVET